MPFVLTLYAQQVLGYSAVEFGSVLDRLPDPGVAVGAIVGQGLVLKVGFRPVATAGLALLAGRMPPISRRSLPTAATSATSSSAC